MKVHKNQIQEQYPSQVAQGCYCIKSYLTSTIDFGNGVLINMTKVLFSITDKNYFCQIKKINLTL